MDIYRHKAVEQNYGEPKPTVLFYNNTVSLPEKVRTDDKEKDNRKLGGGVIMNGNFTKILLVRNATSKKWGIPKGGIEEGESDFDGSLREIREETGINIETAGNIRMAPCITHRGVKIFLFCYSTEAITNVQPIDPTEIDAVAWFPISIITSNNRNFTLLLRDLVKFRIIAIKKKIQTNLINYSISDNGCLVINQYLSVILKRCDKAQISYEKIISGIQDRFPQVFYQPELFKHFEQKRGITNRHNLDMPRQEQCA